jgi:hypothetical protein
VSELSLKIQVEIESGGGRRPLRMVEVQSIPLIGEVFDTGDTGVFNVVAVIHTPFIREYDALVILREIS